MELARRFLSHFPYIKFLLKSLYSIPQGLPPISYSEITDALLQECLGKSDPTILEIGCNDGGQTLWFLEIFENARIYCFEPDPRAIVRFNERVGQRPNVKLFEIALSDQDGNIPFFQSDGYRDDRMEIDMPKGWDLSGSIRQPKDHLQLYPWVTFGQCITVMTTTLDTWCAQNNIKDIDFIWMDVQGAEIDVINGGMNALNRTHFIYMEYSDMEMYEGQNSLKQLLTHLKNFKILIRYPNDVLLRNKKYFYPNLRLMQMIVNSQY